VRSTLQLRNKASHIPPRLLIVTRANAKLRWTLLVFISAATL